MALPSVVLTLAESCVETYTNYPTLEDYHPYPMHWGATQSFMYVNDDSLILSFRGTQVISIWDWLTDLKIRRKKVVGAKGSFHRGFLNAANMVYALHVARLKIMAPHRKVYLTGHSLGAALATCFLVLLATREPDLLKYVESVVTFGSPRVCSPAGASFIDELNVDFHRIAARGDTVTKVPFPILGYRHVGTPFELPGRRCGSDHSMRRVYIPQLRRALEC